LHRPCVSSHRAVPPAKMPNCETRDLVDLWAEGRLTA
jgi:hypothetical protein